ncbi:MAG: hypothetical protein HQL57_06565 [Magnetococcales bacterium]|nr:hypothetical protein [Magnetococcales bacterium]
MTATDPTGRQSAEPYFLLQVRLDETLERFGASGLRHGRAGWIRVQLPWRPLLWQLWTGARQFFQKRYRL